MNCNLSVLIPGIRYYSYLDPNHPTMEYNHTIYKFDPKPSLHPYYLFIIFPYFKPVTILSFCDVVWLCNAVEELYGHVNKSICDLTKLMGA